MTIELGYSAKTLHEQIGSPATRRNMKIFEEDRRAIDRPWARGLISHGEMHGVHRRLADEIARAIVCMRKQP